MLSSRVSRPTCERSAQLDILPMQLSILSDAGRLAAVACGVSNSQLSLLISAAQRDKAKQTPQSDFAGNGLQKPT